MKAMMSGIHKNSDLSRADLGRIERDQDEVGQKVLEVQVQTQNAEELSRDVLQQVQNHRSEFKLLRGELRAILDTTQKLTEKLSLIEDRVTRQHEKKLEQEIKEFETTDAVQDLIEIKEADIANLQTVLDAADVSQNREDLTMILDMLRSQKNELKRVAKEAETRLRAEQNGPITAQAPTPTTSTNVENEVISGKEVQEITLNPSQNV
jgi:DNA repair exonuclease SbcCD ATPase subunit